MLNYQLTLAFTFFLHLILLNFVNAKAVNDKVSTVHPEILVITDQKLRSSFSNESELSNYLDSFWASVNEVFSQLSDPEVKLHISGILNLKKTGSLENTNMGRERNRLSLLRVLNSRSLQFDVPVLMVGLDENGRSNFLPKPSPGITRGSACDFQNALVVIGVKNVHDTTLISQTVSQLKFIFSVKRGKNAISTCNLQETFSECSKEAMKEFFNSREAACLLNVPV